jgi:diguanylate cyclase (GGDEF)-like protein
MLDALTWRQTLSNADELELEDLQALRARRLFQISSLALFALSIAATAYFVSAKWSIFFTLLPGMAMMLLCQRLSRLGKTDWGNVTLLTSIFTMMSALMWSNEGLKDVAFLSFPVILIMAGLLVKAWQFFSILAAMLVYMAFLTLATVQWNLRVNTELSTPEALWRDGSIILTTSAIAIWLILSDLRNALDRVRQQIAKARESQKHLTYLSQHDILTGLPNRTLGRDRIEQAIVQAQRHGKTVALLFIDLDNFKEVNDSMGHTAGDEFLIEVSRRLRLAVRKSDVVCRHGGDEFVVGIVEVSNAEDAASAANNIMGQLRQPLRLREAELVATCSIGVALFPQDALNYEDLLRKADIAMYQAKESGRNDCRFFDEAMNVNIQKNLQLHAQMRSGLLHKEFLLHFQPVINLQSGHMVGAEALIRWRHPSRGMIAPGEFIPAAEKSGIIVEIGSWVVQEACRQMAAWQAQGLPEFVLAINLSPLQFRKGDIVAVVAKALEESGLAPRLLELEITESALIHDTEKFVVMLHSLKSLGVRIAIDDFGTGYSNLTYLQRFKVDKLKIDQSFVMRLLDGTQEKAIVRAIIQMAHSLELATTAEGIEEQAIYDLLHEFGCHYGQGYHIARPMSADNLVQFVNQR